MTDSYTILARYYDRLTADVDYKKWADYIERHFRKQKRPVRAVAELGCGTGSLTRLLARRGYAMTAVDLSPDMLSIAQQKCDGLDVLFLCQDMSRLTLLEPADAVVSCLDSINYITRPAALKRTFQRVHRALAPGGLFLFDVKTPLALESAGGQTYLDEDDDLFCVWRGEYSAKRRVCGYGLDLFVRRPDGAWDRDGEYHEEYAYTLDELEGFLREAGFQRIHRYDGKKLTPPGPQAQRVFFTAGKD